MAETDWVNPGTMAENSAVGDQGWVTKDNAKTLGSGEATCLDLDDTNGATYFLVATNYDFSSIPAGSTIDGVETRVRARANNSLDMEINLWELYEAGSRNALLTPATQDGPGLTTILVDYEAGSLSDDWNWSGGIELSDVQNSGFGQAIQFSDEGSGSGDSTWVDHMPMKIHYTAPVGGGGNLIWPIT